MPSSTVFIRAPTSRPNLRYHVLHVENQVKHINKVAAELAQHLQQTTFTNESRGIVFCADIPSTDELATVLGSSKSHSKMETSERLSNQEAWYEGHAKWIVATSGFLHGIDHPSVRAVIFIGIPYGAINIEQGSGRAGRDRLPANIFLLNQTNLVYVGAEHRVAAHDKDDQCLSAAHRWMLTTTDCRRRLMTELMDGVGVTCSDLDGAEKCDICDPHTQLLQAASLILQPEPSPPSSPVATTRSAITMDCDEEEYPDPGFDESIAMLVDLGSYLNSDGAVCNHDPLSAGPLATAAPQPLCIQHSMSAPAQRPSLPSSASTAAQQLSTCSIGSTVQQQTASAWPPAKPSSIHPKPLHTQHPVLAPAQPLRQPSSASVAAQHPRARATGSTVQQQTGSGWPPTILPSSQPAQHPPMQPFSSATQRPSMQSSASTSWQVATPPSSCAGSNLSLIQLWLVHNLDPS
jgi:hypothetical protein